MAVKVNPICATYLLDNPKELLECFSQGWTYPNRPILINKKYPYKLLYAISPDDFALQINDRISSAIQYQVKEACKRHKQNVKMYRVKPIDIAFLVDMLPVVVRDQHGKYHRAEINSINTEKKNVCVHFVDLGEDGWVAATTVYPPSTDLLRYPKLALLCRLAQVVPFGRMKKWRKYDYAKLFDAKKSSYFSISIVDRGVHQVYLECDKQDIGYKMVMNLGLADYVPLICEYNNNDGYANRAKKMLGKYPRYDFCDWIGQQLAAFGTLVRRVGKNGHIKIHLQLDSNIMQVVNDMLDQLEKFPDYLKNSRDFAKEVGDAVLVRHGADKTKYRATIFQKSGSEYLVKLVDYGDFINVNENDLLLIPRMLVSVPEAATPCYLAELLAINPTKQTDKLADMLNELITEKDLYCRIGFVDYIDRQDPWDARKCIVTLEREEDGKPFSEILQVPKVNLSQSYTHRFPRVSESLAAMLLGSDSAYFPGVRYKGFVSCVVDHESVWLQLEGDDIRAEELTVELNDFYSKWSDCLKLDSDALVPGIYVGAQQNDEDDTRFYRALITEIFPDMKKYKVIFLDYGNNDVVPIGMMKPLPAYFCKDKCFAIQIALPLEFLPEANPDTFLEWIACLNNAEDLSVYIQDVDGINFGWIFSKETSIAHDVVRNNTHLVKLKIPCEKLPFEVEPQLLEF
ncbi:uncharacterized protein LOC110863631 isoform X2 [Folsomia candida]|uniref:uncharacterized protein LOC110863631 isoform X2 n=1 Tax=Folsomia candida TaxID=158441 RepID=UPI000B8FE5D7|nr:uncharacterized protein LOC110863631 isoform X2 [Folsomia candida]